MDSLSDILSNKDFSLPDEVTAIKTFVLDKYNEDVQVSVNQKEILISSRSAGLISSLRFNLPALKQAANTTKKIRLRIG